MYFSLFQLFSSGCWRIRPADEALQAGRRSVYFRGNLRLRVQNYAGQDVGSKDPSGRKIRENRDAGERRKYFPANQCYPSFQYDDLGNVRI